MGMMMRVESRTRASGRARSDIDPFVGIHNVD
jgi:hypothetical protein